MTNNINHVLKSAYEEFLTELSPHVDEESVKEKLRVPIGDLFEKQRTTDKAKSSLGKDFPQAVRLFFSQFLVKDMVDFKRLKYGIQPYEANFLRHLGKERLAFLKLLISVSDAAQEKRKGLLFESVS